MSTAAAPTTAALAASQTAAVRQTLENLAGELGLEVPGFEGSRDGAAVATVVVVGEPKNGKSTLVNALVGQAGLSPVDYAVATATYIAISYGSPGARVYPAGEDLPEEIHLDELASWTSVAGLASNPRAPRVARPVEVTIPAPLLGHVSLIDTPGVGGFDGRHDRATVAALQGATTLLFCADASHPLSEPELRFLTEATASIAHVMFALAKVDENGSWREVLEANRQAIAERAPQFKDAPWFPVAATLAEQALEPALSATAAQALRERSGVDALAAHLVRETAGRARLLEAAAHLKALRTAAAHFKDVAIQRATVISDPPEDVEALLLAEHEALDSLVRVEDQWRVDLELTLNELRAAEMQRLNATVGTILAVATERADDTSVSCEELGDAVNNALLAESSAITERIAGAIKVRVAEVVGDEVDSPAFAMAVEVAERSAEVIALRASRDLVAEGRLQPAQQMPLLMSGTGAVMLTNMALVPLLGAWAVLPGFGLAITATAAAVVFARRQSSVNERRQWVNARLAEARSDLQTVIEQRITSARALVGRAVREWVHTRLRELKASITDLQAQQRRSAEERTRAVNEATERVGNLDRVVRACDTYIAQMLSATAVSQLAGSA